MKFSPVFPARTIFFILICLLVSASVSAQRRPLIYPSLQDQLVQEYYGRRVDPDTALAQLIADNQEFDRLRADEFSDKRGLPPWLRVWWRKAHPESEYNAADPTKGYPLVLKEILEWMMTHQDLKPGPGESDDADADEGRAEITAKARLADSLYGTDYSPKNGIGNKDGENFVRAIIGADLRVSGLQSVARSESDVRVNYFDTQKILVASNNIGGTGRQGVYRSTDGGTTWAQAELPLQVGDAFHSDPTVDWTNDRAWSSTLGISSSQSVLKLQNYVSTDNGATWTFDATASGAQTNVDKQMVWVDHNPSSPFFGQQYAIWHNGLPAFMNRRTAGAAGTWLAAPIQVSGAESTGTAIGGDVKTNSAGEVFGFWPTTTNARVFMVKSTNGGASYGTPVQIATTFDTFDISVPSFSSRHALIYVSGGAYKTATKNMVYATWNDLSGEAGCTAAGNAPGTNAASTCKVRIWFARSTDGGATWQPKVMINNQPGLNDQYNQWMVVDEVTGAIGIIYYDTVGDPTRKKTDIWYQSSFNDGVTWNPAQKVTTGQTDETTGGQDNGNQYGDYNALSGYAGVFYPSWTDRRAGLREEIWTAKIQDAACAFPGAPAIGTATPSAPNQITVTWADGTPSSAKFNVSRAQGTCAAPGAFTQIAQGVLGSPYVDTSVSGAVTYAYKISGTDPTSVCASADSGCVQATATGACTLAPSFAGLTSVTNPGGASCSLNLSWSAATPTCAGPPKYNIYRSTSPGFTPSAANRVTANYNGTSYSDTTPLVGNTTYYYIVRAVDSSNGSEEANTVVKSGVPTGPVTLSTLTETFEGAGGFDNPGWTHAIISGANDWNLSTAQSQTPTHSWNSVSLPSVSERVLTTPSIGVNASTTMSFWHTFAFEGSVANCYDSGTLEYSADGVLWTVVPDAAFTLGGFNGTTNGGFSNPMAGKRAWCSGTVGAMTQVNVNVGSFANGQSIKMRWHEADDVSLTATNPGWFVDSVTIVNAGVAGSCVATASGVTVSGRVMATAEQGLVNARIAIADENGVTRSVVTGRGGVFRFDDVSAGHTYILSVSAKRFHYSPRVLQVVDNVANVDFFPEQ
jgi:hypothetical protein